MEPTVSPAAIRCADPALDTPDAWADRVMEVALVGFGSLVGTMAGARIPVLAFRLLVLVALIALGLAYVIRGP